MKPATRRQLGDYAPYLLLIAFNLAALAILYSIQPRYFLQDDNWAQFGPYLIAGPQLFFEKLQLAYWNPWTSLGVPSLEIGTYALLYPFTYLSYAVARWILRNPSDTVDVFCVAHLVAGTFAAYVFFARFTRDRLVAVLAAVSFAYCGFFLVGGRSWFYVLPLAFYLPAIFWFLFRPLAELTPKRQWLLALLIGAFFLSGNAQLWAYTLLFWTAIFLAYTLGFLRASFERVTAEFLLPLAGRVALVIGPQLLLQGFYIRAVDRYAGGDGFGVGWLNFILPGFLHYSPFPTHMYPHNSSGALYFGGGLFIVAALWGVADLFVRRNKLLAPAAGFSRRDQFLIPLLGTLWIFIILWGSWSGNRSIWRMLSHVPPFGGFTGPFKLIPFVHFFAILFACIRFEKVFGASFRFKKVLIAGLFFVVLAHVASSDAAFYVYAEDSYPAATDPAMQSLPNNERIANVVAPRLQSVAYAQALPHNIGLITKKLTMFGYEPFLTDNREHPLFFWNVVNGATPKELSLIYGSTLSLDLVHDRATRTQLANADPLAFCENSMRPLKVAWDWNALTIYNPGECGAAPIIVAWAYWKYFVVPSYFAKFDADKYRRLRLYPAAGGSPVPAEVVIRYAPPFWTYVLVSLAVFVACELSSAYWRRRLRGGRCGNSR